MTELERHIISLLKRGPYMLMEIARYCRPQSAEDVERTLRTMESCGIVRYLPVVGLYALVDA